LQPSDKKDPNLSETPRAYGRIDNDCKETIIRKASHAPLEVIERWLNQSRRALSRVSNDKSPLRHRPRTHGNERSLDGTDRTIATDEANTCVFCSTHKHRVQLREEEKNSWVGHVERCTELLMHLLVKPHQLSALGIKGNETGRPQCGDRFE
jgi:hypothetical protein